MTHTMQPRQSHQGAHLKPKPLSDALSKDGRSFAGLSPEKCFVPDWLSLGKWGYRIIVNGKGGHSKAHRISYRLLIGTVPNGALVLHRCGNAECINPHHLYLGDAAQNARDRAAHGRTACGFRLPQTKLSDSDVLAIRTSSKRVTDLAKKYSVSKGTISNIRSLRARPDVKDLSRKVEG